MSLDPIDICICTYRRAQLGDTLNALLRVAPPEGGIGALIVADNDDLPSAKPTVEAFAARAPFAVRYVHCPAGNISVARNTGLAAATARYLAYLDDDECPRAGWLSALWAGMQDDVVAVFGPVESVYPVETPLWMRVLDLHSTRPVWVGGEIRTGYTGNVLLDLAALSVRGRRFDLARGVRGGEDTAFFDAVYAAGGRFAYAPEAVVHEPVAPARATFRWLWARRWRMGVTHGSLLVANGQSRARGVLAALGKFGYCFAHAGLCAGRPVARNGALLRGALHMGTCLGLMGWRGAA